MKDREEVLSQLRQNLIWAQPLMNENVDRKRKEQMFWGRKLGFPKIVPNNLLEGLELELLDQVEPEYVMVMVSRQVI